MTIDITRGFPSTPRALVVEALRTAGVGGRLMRAIMGLIFGLLYWDVYNKESVTFSILDTQMCTSIPSSFYLGPVFILCPGEPPMSTSNLPPFPSMPSLSLFPSRYRHVYLDGGVAAL